MVPSGATGKPGPRHVTELCGVIVTCNGALRYDRREARNSIGAPSACKWSLHVMGRPLRLRLSSRAEPTHVMQCLADQAYYSSPDCFWVVTLLLSGCPSL